MSEDSLDTGELLVLDARTLLDLPSTTRRTRDDDDDDDVGDQAEDDHLQERDPIFDPFGRSHVFFAALAIVLFFVDLISDAAVAARLKEEDALWSTLTLCLILVPAFIVNLFSIVWFHQDHEVRRSKLATWEKVLLVTAHVFLLADVVRELDIIRLGWLERREHRSRSHGSEGSDADEEGPFYIHKKRRREANPAVEHFATRKYAERDAAYLGLIRSFTQAGPQLILQLYILSARRQDSPENETTAWFQVVSLTTSLLTLSKSMVSNEQAARFVDPEKPKISLQGNLLHFLWRTCMTASRVATLALFATAYPKETFLFGGLHWLLMTLWIVMMGTSFCGSADNRRHPVAELVYDIVIGWIYVFDVLHVKEGPTRWKYLMYYSILLAEMVVLLSLWSMEIKNRDSFDDVRIHDAHWYKVMSFSVLPGLFVLGTVFLTAFYRWNHPGGKMPDKTAKASLF